MQLLDCTTLRKSPHFANLSAIILIARLGHEKSNVENILITSNLQADSRSFGKLRSVDCSKNFPKVFKNSSLLFTPCAGQAEDCRTIGNRFHVKETFSLRQF